MSERMSYDLKQAKRELIDIARTVRHERPCLVGFSTEKMRCMYTELMQCVEVAHRKNIQLHFDRLTLAYLHLLDTDVMKYALLFGYRSAVVKALEEEEPNRSLLLHLSYSIERVQSDAPNTLPRDRIDNASHYDTLINNGNAFYLCAFRTHNIDKTLLCGFVTKEKESLESLDAPYISYRDALHDLKTRVDRFIIENTLSEVLGEDFLYKRKEALFRWLEECFRERNQIVIFGDQETRGEVAYTMRQLLTNTSHDNIVDLFNAMIGKVAPSRGGKKKVTFYVECYQYSNDDASLCEFMHRQPGLLVNLPEEHETVFDVALVKDMRGSIVSVYFISKPDPFKLDIQRSFVARCKEKVDAERRVKHAEHKSLVETGREILIPYLDEMRNFFVSDYGVIKISGDVTTFLLERMCEISDRESGLDGASRTMKGCISYTMDKANNALAGGGSRNDIGLLTLIHTRIELNEFEKHSDSASSFVARELMRDNENRRVLQHHKEQQTDVSILSVMRGKEILSSTIVPCMVKNCYKTFVTTNTNNNALVINQYDKNESKKRIIEYEKIIDQLVEEDDTETRRAIKAGLYEENSHTRKKKRKRITIERPTPRKKLMTKREAEAAAQAGEFDAAITIVIEGERNDTPNLKSSQVCDYCEKKKKLRSFHTTNVGTKKGVKMTYGYIRNVCHTCVATKNST